MSHVVHHMQAWLLAMPDFLRLTLKSAVNGVASVWHLWPSIVLASAAIVFVQPAVQLRRLEHRVLPWAVPGWRPHTSVLMRVRDALASGAARVRPQIPVIAAAVLVGLTVAWAAHSVLVAAALCGTLASATVLVRRLWTRTCEARERRSIRAELAAVTDFLALAVSAGLSVDGALRYVPIYFRGVLAAVLKDDKSSRTPLQVLAGYAPRNPDLAALVDALTVCSATGAPVAQVLHDQARVAARQMGADAIASAGRREVLMLAPVVFLVFPAVVLVAVFPGWQELHGAGW